ncbi:MAG: efflux RND transporter periplasmic adaptor subunit [Candidatus Krumholzibacteriota bacterium]|nr:efflux RND transporter periplasmic adaptor subunit [Candidatus Krumholzibacteriota bacterium]
MHRIAQARKRPHGGRGWYPILLLSAALALAGCGDGGGDGGAADSTAADSAGAETQKNEKQSSVEAAAVIRGDLVLPITAEGHVRARHEADIRSEVAGRVSIMAAVEGERVRAGQILLRLDDREYRVALVESESTYLQALGRLAVEDEPAALSERLQVGDATGRNGGDIWRDSLDEQLAALQDGGYRRELAEARTGMAGARAAAERARFNLERCEIRAPFDGVVTDLTLSPGEWVSAGQVLCSLVDDVHLEAEVEVLESELGHLALGRPVLMAVPALGDTLPLTVDIVSPRLTPESRSCGVRLRFENRDGRIKPGMFVRADIAGEILPDRLLVPREAVLTRDGRPLVFKIEDGITQWIYVRLGSRNARFVEVERVLQGGSLAAGDQVVTSEHLTLTHGAPVKVTRLHTPRTAWRIAGDAER